MVDHQVHPGCMKKGDQVGETLPFQTDSSKCLADLTTTRIICLQRLWSMTVGNGEMRIAVLIEPLRLIQKVEIKNITGKTSLISGH